MEHGQPRDAPSLTQAALFATCLRCGGPLTRSQHVYCENCWNSTPGQARETRRRRGQARETRRRRGQAIAASARARQLFDAERPGNRPDPEAFAPIREGLAGVKLTEIMAATGLSKTTASQIRSGRTVPHVRHWDALRSLRASDA